MIPEIFEKIDNLQSNNLHSCLVGLLEKTWNSISIEYCTEYLKERIECINSNDLVRVELSADEVRSAVYENILRWKNTENEYVMKEWMELTLQQQNDLLIETFPANEVYGVTGS